MGPTAAKSYPGVQLVGSSGKPGERARQEIDYGRRGLGYIFGAFMPKSGDALTAPYAGRTIVNWVDFLAKADAWVPEVHRTIYAVVDNLSTHHARDVLLFCLAHPRWNFVFQPTNAGYLNLIEPWWKVLRSLALKGRRFETWEDIEVAIQQATSYWNAHKHPFLWGHRRRHHPKRRPGIATVPPHRLTG